MIVQACRRNSGILKINFSKTDKRGLRTRTMNRNHLNLMVIALKAIFGTKNLWGKSAT
jgi:hypothetical protein